MKDYKYVRRTLVDMFYNKLDSRRYSEICADTLEAVNKQIPKKVITGCDEQDDIYCPVCKFALATVDDHEYESTFYKYCPHCSQKLDWSDTK